MVALEKMPGPAQIRASGPEGPLSLPPDRAAVTSDRELFDLLVKEGPVVLVSTEVQAKALVAEWRLEPGSKHVETVVKHEPSGAAVPLADAFPGLPLEVLSEHGDVELVPCEALWKETRTARGILRSDLMSYYEPDERAFLHRGAQDDEGVLREILPALSVEISDSTMASALRHNIDAAESYRIAEILAVPTVAGKLAAMVGEEKLWQLLPQDVAAEPRALNPDQLAGMILAVDGSATLSKYRRELAQAGFRPPQLWGGSKAALRFVRALGLPDEFAGAPAPRATRRSSMSTDR